VIVHFVPRHPKAGFQTRPGYEANYKICTPVDEKPRNDILEFPISGAKQTLVFAPFSMKILL